MKFVFLLVLLCAVGSNAGQQELPPGALPFLLFSSVMFHDLNQFAGLKGKLHSSSFEKRGAYHITCISFVLQLVSMETLSGIQISN